MALRSLYIIIFGIGLIESTISSNSTQNSTSPTPAPTPLPPPWSGSIGYEIFLGKGCTGVKAGASTYSAYTALKADKDKEYAICATVQQDGVDKYIKSSWQCGSKVQHTTETCSDSKCGSGCHKSEESTYNPTQWNARLTGECTMGISSYGVATGNTFYAKFTKKFPFSGPCPEVDDGSTDTRWQISGTFTFVGTTKSAVTKTDEKALKEEISSTVGKICGRTNGGGSLTTCSDSDMILDVARRDATANFKIIVYDDASAQAGAAKIEQVLTSLEHKAGFLAVLKVTAALAADGSESGFDSVTDMTGSVSASKYSGGTSSQESSGFFTIIVILILAAVGCGVTGIIVLVCCCMCRKKNDPYGNEPNSPQHSQVPQHQQMQTIGALGKV